MNQMTIHSGKSATMTSVELVSFINEIRKADAKAAGEKFPSKDFSRLRHEHFMAKVLKVLGDTAPKFSGAAFYTNGTGAKVERAIYNFPKREACLMAMSYSYDIQAKVFDKMTELESSSEKKQFEIPQTRAEALRLAADLEEQNSLLAEMVKDAAPKVDFYDAVVESECLISVRDAAKQLGTGERRLYELLRNEGLVDANRVPYQKTINYGWLIARMSKYFLEKKGIWVQRPVCMITGKGLAYLQKTYFCIGVQKEIKLCFNPHAKGVVFPGSAQDRILRTLEKASAPLSESDLYLQAGVTRAACSSALRKIDQKGMLTKIPSEVNARYFRYALRARQ